MKITEEEFRQNREEHRWIDQRDIGDLIMFVIGMALLTLILYGLKYG